MAGDVSERRRTGERDDLPRESKEVDEGEVDVSEVKERKSTESPEDTVEHRLQGALRDLAEQEERKERVSQTLEDALGDLKQIEQRQKSTETKLREALESIRDDEDDTQLTPEEAVLDSKLPVRETPRGEAEHNLEKHDGPQENDDEVGPEHARSKNDAQEVSDANPSPHADNVEKSSQEIPEELSEDNPETSTKQNEDDSHIPNVKFKTMEEVGKAIQQHAHVKDGLSDENYEKCKQYIRVISEEDDVSSKEIAERENLDERVVNNWREGGRPKAILTIEKHEMKRLEHESHNPEKSLEHRINPQAVHEATADALEKENHSVNELSDIIYNIHQKIENPSPNNVYYAELYNSEKSLIEDRLRALSLEIRSNREAIQADLNRRLGLDCISDQEIRIAVSDSRLYYWHIDTSADRWVNVLADQRFYMSKEDKNQLIDEMKEHLHIRGKGQTSEYYLNDIISQLSGLENPAANRIKRYDPASSLDGEIMHLIGDIQRKSLEEYKTVITHMGTKEAARVSNLKFPNIHEYRMKFVAIAESDAHLDDEGRFSYYEKNNERQRIAVGVFQEFGDFAVKTRKDNSIQVNLPRLLGTMAEHWGIPRGDKAIHNRGLHESIINETLEIKTHYLRQMVPEDGSISRNDVSVTRHLVLHAGERMEKYREAFGIKPLVNHEHIEFVREHGIPQPAYLCYNAGEVIKLHISKLEELATDQEHSKVARDLVQIIDKNEHKLLSDEVNHFLRPLGIEMKDNPRSILYYKTSERLSVCYPASTQTKNDAIRWVLIAPPEHPNKMDTAIELVNDDSNRSRQIAMQIEEDGLHIHPIWEEYLH